MVQHLPATISREKRIYINTLHSIFSVKPVLDNKITVPLSAFQIHSNMLTKKSEFSEFRKDLGAPDLKEIFVFITTGDVLVLSYFFFFQKISLTSPAAKR